MTRPALLDASTVIAYLQAEPGGDLDEAFLVESYITSVNMAEVITVLNRRGCDGQEIAADLVEAGVTVVPVGWTHLTHIGQVQQAHTASHAKGTLSLGDLCCLSYALEQDMHVYTADREWADLGLELDMTLLR